MQLGQPQPLINHYNKISNIGNNWQHNPAHRQGVRYGNTNVQQHFGNNNLKAGVSNRMDFRGRDGQQVLRPGQDRPGAGDRAVGLAALNCSAASRIDFRPASSRMHAHDGESCSNQFVRNGSSFVRIWRGFDDCRADFVVRNSICQVRRSVILSDGSPLRHRAPVCLVRVR